ncbi:MAG: hypothetical protein D6795_01065, partial [Deltaproteobacteria bacterium]
FTLEGVQPIDLFPQTHHIESVAFLRRSPATGSLHGATNAPESQRACQGRIRDDDRGAHQ